MLDHLIKYENQEEYDAWKLTVKALEKKETVLTTIAKSGETPYQRSKARKELEKVREEIASARKNSPAAHVDEKEACNQIVEALEDHSDLEKARKKLADALLDANDRPSRILAWRVDEIIEAEAHDEFKTRILAVYNNQCQQAQVGYSWDLLNKALDRVISEMTTNLIRDVIGSFSSNQVRNTVEALQRKFNSDIIMYHSDEVERMISVINSAVASLGLM